MEIFNARVKLIPHFQAKRSRSKSYETIENSNRRWFGGDFSDNKICKYLKKIFGLTAGFSSVTVRVFNAAVHKNLIDFFHSVYRRLVIISRLSICRYDPTQREERVAYRVAIPPQILLGLCHTQSVTTVQRDCESQPGVWGTSKIRNSEPLYKHDFRFWLCWREESHYNESWRVEARRGECQLLKQIEVELSQRAAQNSVMLSINVTTKSR